MESIVIQKYIEEHDISIQSRLFEIYETIETVIPDAEECFSWG